jgi:hypothetical protein
LISSSRLNSRGVVQFTHPSVLEHLKSAEASPDFAVSKTGHQHLAKICLIYLLSLERQYKSRGAIPRGPHPFLSYAAEFWHQHVRAGSTVECRTPAFDLIKKLLDPETSCYGKWLDPESESGLPRVSDIQPLYSAALFGLPEVVQWLLTSAVTDVNAKLGGRHEYALVAAAAHGHEDVIKILLENGANVDVLGPYGNALQTASYFHRDAVVRLLEESIPSPTATLATDERAHPFSRIGVVLSHAEQAGVLRSDIILPSSPTSSRDITWFDPALNSTLQMLFIRNGPFGSVWKVHIPKA